MGTTEEELLKLRKKIGEKLQRLRNQSLLTQTELGEKAGISLEAISKIERFQTSPNIDTLARLCIALNVSITSFFIFDQIPDSSFKSKLETLVLLLERKDVETITFIESILPALETYRDKK